MELAADAHKKILYIGRTSMRKGEKIGWVFGTSHRLKRKTVCVQQKRVEKLFSSFLIVVVSDCLTFTSQLVRETHTTFFPLLYLLVVYEFRIFSVSRRKTAVLENFQREKIEASLRRKRGKGGGNEIENENCPFTSSWLARKTEKGGEIRGGRNFHRFVPTKHSPCVRWYNDRRLSVLCFLYFCLFSVSLQPRLSFVPSSAILLKMYLNLYEPHFYFWNPRVVRCSMSMSNTQNDSIDWTKKLLNLNTCWWWLHWNEHAMNIKWAPKLNIFFPHSVAIALLRELLWSSPCSALQLCLCSDKPSFFQQAHFHVFRPNPQVLCIESC